MYVAIFLSNIIQRTYWSNLNYPMNYVICIIFYDKKFPSIIWNREYAISGTASWNEWKFENELAQRSGSFKKGIKSYRKLEGTKRKFHLSIFFLVLTRDDFWLFRIKYLLKILILPSVS